MKDDEHLVFLWWGIDATEEDAQSWVGFQLMMSHEWGSDTVFIEMHTDASWQETISRLEREGYVSLHTSGGFQRMFAWMKGGVINR